MGLPFRGLRAYSFSRNLAQKHLPRRTLSARKLPSDDEAISCTREIPGWLGCDNLLCIPAGMSYHRVIETESCCPDSLYLLEDALKFKFVVLLICLFLFVAAVDTIPDPPAINPPSGHTSVISVHIVRGPTTMLEKEWFISASSRRSENNNWFLLRLVFDTKPAAVSPLPLVHRAANTSPPAFS